MRLYHRTTLRAAATIQKAGFRNRTGSYMMADDAGTPVTLKCVSLADRLLGSGHGVSLTADVYFILEIPVRKIAGFEIREDGKPYREWCVPAVLVNTYFRDRVPRRT